MRIAFLTHEPFFPPSGGGSAEAVYLVRELVRRSHEVHLFCPAIKDPTGTAHDFRVHLHEFKAWTMGRYARLRNLKYILYPFFLAGLVEKIARTHRFDLVLSQHAISAVAAGRLRRTLGIPVVMNFLDYLTAFMETWPTYLAPPALLGLLKRFELSLPRRYSADAILTVSDTLADLFRKTGFPSERILPIHYGFDASLFPFVQPPDPATEARAPVVVMHGSLDHHHVGPIASGAIARVSRTRPDTIFRFVGQRTGPLDACLRSIRTRAPAARIETTGFVPYPEVHQHLRDATVGIVPYEESTGTHCAFVAKTVEYLALGLPVVSTPLDNLKRYFHNEPMIRFSDFSEAGFADGILSWINDQESVRPRFARQASDRVRSSLDWPVLCRRAVDFIEATAASTTTRSPHPDQPPKS
jgi:glycosyltransferase involved in cell wall biosynthesis